jgi:hypothetical protein
MNQNRPEQMLYSYFNNNEHQKKSTDRLLKLEPACPFLEKFLSVYNPKQEPSLNKTMTPSEGKL